MVTTANLWNIPHTDEERAVWSLANRVDHDEIRNAIARQSSVIASLAMTSQGTGYTSAPTVQIGPPNIIPGTQATAVASFSSTSGITLTLTNAGLGYSSAPLVTLVGGGGTGALATATVNYKHLTVYPLDPIPMNALDQWFTWHQQTHEDLLNALNLPGNDQESLNFNDAEATDFFFMLHVLDHNDCRRALGI